MRKARTALALIAVTGVVTLAAAPAAHAQTPAGTTVTMTSTNFNMQIFGFVNIMCNANWQFTTPGSPQPFPNLPMGITLKSLSGCNVGTATVSGTWTLSFRENVSGDTSANQNTTNIATLSMPNGAITITGTICGTITVNAATITAAYTDGSSMMAINASVPYTSTYCGSGSMMVSASFSLSPALTVR